MAALVEGALSARERASLHAHVDGCDECRLLLAQVGRAAEPLPSDLEVGRRVGRYVVLERVGAGAMGVVHAAYDPELRRRLALKVLHPGAPGGELSAAEARERLLREAQAIARLQHPHVVAVHDVVMADGGDVCVVMEFVEGGTLADWMREPRGWREVLAVFRDAGHGLEAAHAAGLVHRDFKPSNVLMGRDGRARVTDFGLVRNVGPGLPAPASVPPTAQDTAVALTVTGALFGTPAYMAPEQFQGLPADVRSDQFSFCVALYEALYRERPFPGDTPPELAAAVASGQVRPPPRGSRVPAWLRQRVLRGLCARPEDRYPDLGALLAALGRDPARARRQWLGAGVALSLLGVGAFFASGARAQLMCRNAAEGVSRAWDAGRREQVRAAFLATGLPYAGDAFEGTTRLLDTYGDALGRARVEACEATHLRGEQSEALLDLRMQCLQERGAALDSLAGLLQGADAALVERARAAAEALPGVEGCASGTALLGRTPPPQEPRARERLSELQAEVARGRVLRTAARYDEALKTLEGAVNGAGALGYRPLEAEALLELGLVQTELVQPAQAEATLHRALTAAQAGRDDRASASAVIELIRVNGGLLRQDAQAHRWADLARAMVERAGGDPRLEVARLSQLGLLQHQAKRFEDAIGSFRAALALHQKHVGAEGLGASQLHSQLGSSLIQLGRLDEALTEFRQSLTLSERLLGGNHPQVAVTMSSIGKVLLSQGHVEDALEWGRRALAIQERTFGPDTVPVARVLEMLAFVLPYAGRTAEARDHLLRALAIYEARLGPGSLQLTRVLNNLASMALELGDTPGAHDFLARAVAIDEKHLGPTHPDTALHLSGLGETLLDLGRADEAITKAERAMAILEGVRAEGHLGQVLVHVHYLLGRALWASGKSRPRAHRLVLTARDLARSLLPALEVEQYLKDMEAWLAQHPAP